MLLARHFFAVALYAIWVMFTHPRRVTIGEKAVYVKPRLEEYPFLVVKCAQVVSSAVVLTRSIPRTDTCLVLDRVYRVLAACVDGDTVVVSCADRSRLEYT